jgi:PilZ domain-containing protein
MPFKIRPCQRFSVCCPVTYIVGRFQGHGTVWNVSHSGWRFSGNLPLRIGEVCSLTVKLSIDQRIYVAAGIVRWVRGEAWEDQEYGVETLVIDDESQEDVEEYLMACNGERPL